MEYWQAIVLGLVEGVTEYLPVSSTGHLLVAQRLLGLDQHEAANAYAISIQAGAILAVLGLYRVRLAGVVRGAIGRDPEGAALGRRLLLAFLPAAILGLLFDEAIEERLFGPWPIIAAWTVGAVVILVVERWRQEGAGGELHELTWRGALIIGLMQALALWPGTSRSLATILGGLLAGLSLAAAVEFSFLLGLLTLGAATCYKAVESGDAMLEAYGLGPLLVGFLAAWLSAVLAIRWMVAWLSRRGLTVFAWWRLLAAVLLALLIGSGSVASS